LFDDVLCYKTMFTSRLFIHLLLLLVQNVNCRQTFFVNIATVKSIAKGMPSHSACKLQLIGKILCIVVQDAAIMQIFFILYYDR
jgi:hypothetical protein